MIICNTNNCKEKKYIGATGRILKYRLADHRGYVNNNVIFQGTGQHFNLPGQSLVNMNIMILEQVKKRPTIQEGKREILYSKVFHFFIMELIKKCKAVGRI